MADQANMRIETRERELVFSRVFDAPRATVFAAFSTSEALSQWWGPKGWTMRVSKLDFRPGGTRHYCMLGPRGEESWGLTTYIEIVENERIVSTDVLSNAEGAVVEGMPAMRVTVEFADEDGKTRVTSTTESASAEELKQLVELLEGTSNDDMGVVQGMTETWDRLEEYLAALSR